MPYIYLASPYSDPDPRVRKRRHLAAEAAVHWMLCRKIWVYSPIVHCHFLAENFEMPTDRAFWRPYNRAMLRQAVELWVLRIPGSNNSSGITEELNDCLEFGIPFGSIRPNGTTYVHSPLPNLEDKPCTSHSTTS
jgi:Domain of unknown function (DUF1937)